MRIIEPKLVPLPFSLPDFPRRRPRSFEEWSALRRWGRLSSQENLVIGYQLRAAREAKDLSQAELASRLGCSQQAVSQAERWSSNPTMDFVQRWAKALGVELEVALRESTTR